MISARCSSNKPWFFPHNTMSCKKLSRKARAEQDYWLSFADIKSATDQERLDFLRFDSHGIDRPLGNPILDGKIHHGQYGEMMRDAYFDTEGGWIGGLWLVADYVNRVPFGVRPLVEWFGPERVQRWCEAFLNCMERR